MQEMVQGGSFNGYGSYSYGLGVRAGQRYLVELRAGSDHPSGTLSLSTVGLAHGTQRQDVFSHAYASGVTRLVFTAETDDLLLINASGWSDAGETLDFELVAREIAADDHADLPSGATPLQVGQTQAGELDWAGDVDCFRASLQAGQSYRLVLTGDDPAALLSALLQLRGPVEREALAYFDAVNTSSPARSELMFTPAVDGVYTLQVDSPYLASIGSYTLSLETRSRDDHGDLPSQSSGLVLGHSEQGRIDGVGDADWFSIVAEAGQRIAVSLRPVRWAMEPGLSSGPSLRLTAPDQAEGWTGSGSGSVPQLVFTAATDGVYQVRVEGEPGHGLAGDLYRVDAQLLEPDDAPDAGVGKALMMGLPMHGVLDVGADKDVYSGWVQAGQRYRVSLVDDPAGAAGRAADPYWLYAHSADDLEGLGSVWLGSGARSLIIEPTAAGRYDFVVMRWEGGAAPAAHYQLEWMPIDDDDHGDMPAWATEVALDTNIRGRIDSPDDVDYFKIPVKAGVRYWLSVEVPSAGKDPAAVSMLSMLSLYLQEAGSLPMNQQSRWLDRDGPGGLDDFVNDCDFQPSVDGTVIARVSSLPEGSAAYTVRVMAVDGDGAFPGQPQDGGWLQVGGPSELGRVIDGTPRNDKLHGTPLDDRLRGGEGNDELIGGGGRDLLLGGDGIDTAVIPLPLQAATLQAPWTGRVWPVTGRDSWFLGPAMADADGAAQAGMVTLQGVERLQFSDGFLALDMDGHAGTVARLMTVLFGANDVLTDWVSAGIGLAWLDAGRSAESLAAAALADWAFPQRAGSDEPIDQWLWICRNAGGDPQQQGLMFSHGVDALMHGQPLAGLVVEAAQSLGVTQQLELMGLPRSGLNYEPAPAPMD